MSEYINANELKERIEKELNTAYVFDKYDSGRRDTLNWILYGVIADLSAADVAPVVHGHWKNVKRVLNSKWGECSNCNMANDITSYCPHCGAKIDEEAENEV